MAASTLLLGSASSAVRGDPLQSAANQRSHLPGGRAALLGGAFTALSDDASGSYYNPAGLSFADESRFEVTATTFRTSDTIYENTVNDEPFEERSQEIYPSFLGGTTRVSRLTLGYSFITLDSRNVYQQNGYDDISTEPGTVSSYGRTYQESSFYIWAGASAAFRLSDRWSIGSSAFYYQRDVRFSTTELQHLNGGGIIDVSSTLKTLNTGVASVHGIVYRAPTFALGASVRMAQALSDSSTLSQDVITYDPTTPSGSEPTITSSSTNYPALDELNPPTYSFGVAWFPAPFFLISSDAMVHEGVQSPHEADGGHDLHTTVNYSVGVELSAGPVSLLGGWFTNSSLYRAPDPEKTGQPAAIDYVGWSGGIGWHIGDVEGQLGVQRQTGSGEAQMRSGSSSIQEVRSEVSSYLMSGKVPL